jgi:hypothetical protein
MKSVAGIAMQLSMKVTIVATLAVLVGLLRAHRLANELVGAESG